MANKEQHRETKGKPKLSIKDKKAKKKEKEAKKSG